MVFLSVGYSVVNGDVTFPLDIYGGPRGRFSIFEASWWLTDLLRVCHFVGFRGGWAGGKRHACIVLSRHWGAPSPKAESGEMIHLTK